jgi:hypothetical protein
MAVAAVYIMYLRVPPYFCVGAGAVVVGSGFAVVAGAEVWGGAGVDADGVGVCVGVAVGVVAASPQPITETISNKITNVIKYFLMI